LCVCMYCACVFTYTRTIHAHTQYTHTHTHTHTHTQVPKQTPEDVDRRNKLRQEQTLRLTEMARVKREEKLLAITNNLTALLELQIQLKATKAREAAPIIEKIQALGVPEVRLEFS
jgi:hypothetical protein